MLAMKEGRGVRFVTDVDVVTNLTPRPSMLSALNFCCGVHFLSCIHGNERESGQQVPIVHVDRDQLAVLDWIVRRIVDPDIYPALMDEWG